MYLTYIMSLKFATAFTKGQIVIYIIILTKAQ